MKGANERIIKHSFSKTQIIDQRFKNIGDSRNEDRAILRTLKAFHTLKIALEYVTRTRNEIF